MILGMSGRHLFVCVDQLRASALMYINIHLKYDSRSAKIIETINHVKRVRQ